MLHHTNYMPILRSKQAEFDSLGQLAERDRPLITPLIDVVPEALIIKKQYRATEGLIKLARNIGKNWHSYPLCIDMRLLGMRFPGVTGQMLTTLYSALHRPTNSLIPDWRIPIVPVTGLALDEEYEATVRTIVSGEQAGLCLRLSDSDIRNTTLPTDIGRFLARMRCTPDDTYVVVDFKYIEENRLPSVPEVCMRLPYLSQWKSVVIAAGSFPEDLNDLEVGEKVLPRHEWCAWHSQVMATPHATRYIGFGDYGVYHPRYREPGHWPPSLSIRYASTDHWLIMRGKKVRPNGPGYEQYLQHSVALREREEYLNCGPSFSAGDLQISQKAAAHDAGNLSQPGSTTTWLTVGFNHHITLTGRNVAAVREAL